MLEILGRIHGPGDIFNAVEEANAAGFDSINLDIMFALPGQDVALAMADLEAAIGLGPTHLSWYQLTLEPNTVFHRSPPAGIPDDGLAWEIQVAGQEQMAVAGFGQYEISAYAQEGHRCRHNLNYWEFGDYLAAGAGAHGKLTTREHGVYRYRKPAHPQAYIEFIEDREGSLEPDAVSDSDIGFEFMLNALRLTGGFSGSLFESRTGRPFSEMTDILDAAVADGLLESPGDDRWRPTRRGFRFLNDLQARFLPP
jgi:oxygen-independent coproporphyrinogen-3 oxidase